MLEVILDTLIDSFKMLPFLFISYLIIEFVEHKSSNKITKTLKTSGKYGPIIGAILGCFPQCGFSVTASNLYAGRVITLGTLIAVFLTTSDEAIPVLLANPSSYGEIIKILAVKLLIGIVFGFIIDFILRLKSKNKNTYIEEEHEHIHDMCSHCHCKDEKILIPSLKHTFSTFIFILIVSFILNTIIHYIGPDRLSTFLLNGSIFQPFIAGLIGLIPNCASSILLTELYLSGTISFASIIAGLSTGAGLGVAILFKANKNLKESFSILGLLYGIGVLSGLIIEVIGLLL